MQKQVWPVAILAAASALANPQQQGQVGGPVAGYVFDTSVHALRPVLGIPGASIMGDPLTLGYDVASAVVAPKADGALVVATGGSVHFVRLSGGAASEVPLNGVMGQPDRVVFSPSGTAVALVAGGRAQVFGGLPDAPVLAATMDLTSAGAAPVSAESAGRTVQPAAGSMALSDDGQWILAATAGGVQVIGTGGTHTIAEAGRGTLLAFAPGSHDAAMLASHQPVTLLHSVDSATTTQTLAPEVAGVTGLAFSANGKSLLLAGGAQPVTIIDVASGNQTGVACNCAAAGLMRMGNVYRLNEAGAGPLWLLDPAAGNPRTVFVPAGGSE